MPTLMISTPGSTVDAPFQNDLLAWWKADAGVLANDSNQVGSWQDQSGNSNVITNATDANKPVWIDGVQNGLPALRFTAASLQVLANTATPPLCTALDGEDTPLTVYVAVKHNSTGALRTYFSLGRNATSTFQALHITAANLFQTQRGDDASVNVSRTAAGAMTTIPYLLCCSFAGTTVTLRRNGVVTDINNTSQDVGTMTLTRLAIGAWVRNTAIQYLDGDVYEVLVYSVAHDATQAEIVESYLNNKWDLY